MNKPFDFLDAEEEETDDDGGFLWIPLTIGGLVIIALLTIPIMALLKSDKNADDWADFTETTDAIEVNLETGEDPLDDEDLMTYSDELDEFETEEDKQVDAALSGLGGGVTVPALATINPPGKKVKRVIPITQPEVKSLAGKSTREVTVQPGDTLYGLAKKNGSTPDEIADASGIKTEQPIHVGQTLSVPIEPSAPIKPTSHRTVRPTAPVSASSVKPVVGRRVFSPSPSPQTPTIVSPIPRKVSSTKPVVATTPLRRAPQPIVPTTSPRRTTQPVQPTVVLPMSPPPTATPTLFPISQANEDNPLDEYNTAISYRVQRFDNLSGIADSLSTTPEELIKLNGRSNIKQGELLVVPVDNCLVKNK